MAAGWHVGARTVGVFAGDRHRRADALGRPRARAGGGGESAGRAARRGHWPAAQPDGWLPVRRGRGAGFAIVEGILNGTLALRMSGSWAGLMVFRGAAAAMHCLASGLAGLGWQAILVERRWLRGIGLGLLAVCCTARGT